jgi:hypothetical protein
MKAEERKELETNILADKLGRMVKGAKRGPSRRGIFVFIVVVVAMVAGFIFLQMRRSETQANAARWKNFLIGIPQFVKGSEQDKLVRMRLAHQLMWQEGVNKLLVPNQMKTAMEAIKDAQSKYTEAARVFSEDPLLGGEANFHLGIIHELLCIEDPANTDANFKEAVKYYHKAAKAWKPDSPLGKMAKDRIATLQYAVTDDTIARLKKQFNQQKDIAAQPNDQEELETVIGLLKPLRDKVYEKQNELSDAVDAALSKGGRLADDARLRWQSKIMAAARDHREDAERIYAMIGAWAQRPQDPHQFNPHNLPFNIPGMPRMDQN